MASTENGAMIISLDFELYWGVHDVFPLTSYKKHLIGAHEAIHEMLQLFTTYQIHATWGIVGLLYCEDKQEISDVMPVARPSYTNQKLSAYDLVQNRMEPIVDERIYFAPSLINKISQTAHQEIATHTFSHYYTLEHGQTLEQFAADIDAAIQIAKQHQHNISSIIFPRNQINEAYIQICANKGITAYRGNEDGTIYQIEANEQMKYWKRGLRFIDRYINLFGHQTYNKPLPRHNMPMNLRASRFLNPFSKRLALLERFRLQRIKRAMTYAAKHGEVFHLWWHPHNFGVYREENLHMLHEILVHFTSLQQQYGFISQNMQDIATEMKSNIVYLTQEKTM